jgi:hypothetical protein
VARGAAPEHDERHHHERRGEEARRGRGSHGY